MGEGGGKINYHISLNYLPGAYLVFGFLHGGLFEGRTYLRGTYKVLLVVGHIPVEVVLLVNYFFNATRTHFLQEHQISMKPSYVLNFLV